MPPKPSAMDRAAFVAAFGDIFEHTPQIAAAAWESGLGPEADRADGLHAAMTAAMRRLSDEAKRALIRAHPDLAGRLALAKQLTADSTGEQASAGLDRLTDAEKARFTELNDAYKTRFGFPFIMAVKGRAKAEIMAAFERRLAHDAATEFTEALAQIERIALLRLKDRMS